MNLCCLGTPFKEWNLRDLGYEGCGGWDYIISLALHLPPQCMKQGKLPSPGTLPLSPVSQAPTPSPLSLWEEEPPLLACWWTSRIHLPWHQVTPLEEATVVNVVPDCPTPCLAWAPPSFLADRHSQFFSDVGNSDLHSKYRTLPAEAGIFWSALQGSQGLQYRHSDPCFLF